MRQKTPNGFSLIELLIVVAIILVIAAIAIPNLLRARISANEASCISSIHAVNTGEITYTTLFPQVGYSGNLAQLGPGGGCISPANACIIDANVVEWYQERIHLYLRSGRRRTAFSGLHTKCRSHLAWHYRPAQFLFRSGKSHVLQSGRSCRAHRSAAAVTNEPQACVNVVPCVLWDDYFCAESYFCK